jgi:hypothetical protein
MTELAVLVLGSWYADGVGLLALERAELELSITHTRNRRWRGHRLCLVSGERCAGLMYISCIVAFVTVTRSIILLTLCGIHSRPRPAKEICCSRYGLAVGGFPDWLPKGVAV